jgi:selenide,water dikinase
MTKLNDDAAGVALAVGATGATDVTGFGLLGHLGRAMAESDVDAVVEVSMVPLLPGSRELAEAGVMPEGSRRNLAWAEDLLDRGGHGELEALLMADAQTSGGLVFGVSPDRIDEALVALSATGHAAAAIGHVLSPAGESSADGGTPRLRLT